MKKFSLLLLSFTLLLIAGAQKTLTLKDCITYALLYNLQVKDAQYQSSLNKIALQQAKFLRLPVVGVNLNQGLNTGKSIDPYSNQFIDQTINFGNYNAGLDLTLFNGLQISNTIKRSLATMQAGELQTGAAKNLVILNVVRNYLLVISSRQIINATQVQLSLTEQQRDFAGKKVNAGVFAGSQVAELDAQVATEQISLSTAENNYELAKLNLFLAMNFEPDETVDFKEEPATEFPVVSLTSGEVYEAALKQLPDVQSIQVLKEAARYDKAVAKSWRYPTLSFFANAGTNYSSSVGKTRFVPDGTTSVVTTTSSDNYITVGGVDYYSQQKATIQNGSYQPFTYVNQLNSNINSAVGVTLHIPILNGLQAKVRVANADATLQHIDAQLYSVKNQLKNAVEQSVQNLKNTVQRITLIEKQVAAFQQTLTNASLKMDNGTFSTLDYVVAKSNYDKAKVDLIQAQSERQLWSIIVKFYQTGSW